MKKAASLCIIILTLLGFGAAAQCTLTISTFPYAENFEAGNGNWGSGGTASSWQWGIINKPVITAAGAGQRGWTTGGLTGASYNDGEDSWLRSPCFNFTTLVNPMISFKIFWETERQYDGASIEYSTNGGTSWNLLGSQNSNSNCDGENWFNFSPVRYLGNEPGWSGNIQPSTGPCVGGGGSGAWLTAKHKLSFLAGRSSVRFRFRFGAGTSCNQYDGLAIDDVRIEEVPANPAAFTYQCSGINTVAFSTVNKVCQTGVSWNFGDPASGSANTSTSFNPVHVFSSPGPYTVTMTATFRSAPSSTSSQVINILVPVTSVSAPILCNGATGNVTVSVIPTDAYTYTWNSTPPQTATTLMGVPAGTYTVDITSPNACVNSGTITLTEPPVLTVSLTPLAATCASGTGSITSAVNGGTAPYSYLWSDGSTATSVNNKVPGSYSLTVQDRNGCRATGSATIASPVNNIQVTSVVTNASCGNSNGSISITASGGTAPYTYLWSNGQTTTTINNLDAGSYSITVRDGAGCTFTSSPIIVSDNSPAITITPTTTPAQCSSSNGSINVTISGGTAPYTYLWSTGATTPLISNLSSGDYRVTVTDINGCSATSGDISVAQVNSNLVITPQTTPSLCGNNNGSINLIVAGGTAPYTYSWSNGATTAAISNLSPGNYRITVTDMNGCVSVPLDVVINDENADISIQTQVQPARCVEDNGSITLTVSGGTAPYSYSWNTGATTRDISLLPTGSYSVSITDANGCTASLNNIVVNRSNNFLNVSIGPDRNYCPGMTVTLSPGNQFSNYVWQDGSHSSTINVSQAGTYSVTVTDEFGCTGTDTVLIYSNCNDLYFPSAFTPNGDSRNETFGALGDFTGLRDFELVVYGRWGQEVFRTTDPTKRWNGTYKGKLQGMQSFVWMSTYTIGNRMKQTVKGTVTLVH